MSDQTNAHRGLMFLDCPECGSRFFKMVRCEEDATCRCGARIQTEIMAKAEYTCPGCQRITHLWTNTETATLDIKCQCGERFEVPWNCEHRAYMN